MAGLTSFVSSLPGTPILSYRLFGVWKEGILSSVVPSLSHLLQGSESDPYLSWLNMEVL